MGRVAVCLSLLVTAAPLAAEVPALPVDFDLAGGAEPRQTAAPSGRVTPGYPTEVPRVPANDALRPPQLLWYPSPASLVKVVPAKVRYKLRF